MNLNSTKRNYVWYHISGSISSSALFLSIIQMPNFILFFIFLTSIVPKNEFMLLDSAGFICANDQLFYGCAELIV